MGKIQEIPPQMYDYEDRKTSVLVINRKGAVHEVTKMHYEAFAERDRLQKIKKEDVIEAVQENGVSIRTTKEFMEEDGPKFGYKLKEKVSVPKPR